jgi:thiol:disulfide interchange protein DsbD
LGLYRLPHDSPVENIGVPRLLFSAAFIGLAFYLTPALFKHGPSNESQRPMGAVYAWVDSFLLPDAQGQASGQGITANLPFAVAEARDYNKKHPGQPKRIFVDFTGVTCVNCKINERNVFSKAEIQKLFQPYAIVQIYTDTVPKEFYAPEIRAELSSDDSRSEADAKEVNLPFQRKVFRDEQLPLYVVLEPQADGRILQVGVYDEGRINNEAAFAEFLRDPEKWASKK